MERKLQYKDLDLKGLREKCGIDFAHYTFKKECVRAATGPRIFPLNIGIKAL